MQIPARSNLLHRLQLAGLLIIFNVSTEDNIRFHHSSVKLHIILLLPVFSIVTSAIRLLREFTNFLYLKTCWYQVVASLKNGFEPLRIILCILTMTKIAEMSAKIENNEVFFYFRDAQFNTMMFDKDSTHQSSCTTTTATSRTI